MQVVAHVSALVWLIGIPGVVGPLVAWLIRREDPSVEPHAREALNFHLSMLIYGFLGIGLIIALVISIIGALVVPAVILAGLGLWVYSLVATLIGAVRASRGELYRYPLNLRIIS